MAGHCAVSPHPHPHGSYVHAGKSFPLYALAHLSPLESQEKQVEPQSLS